MSRINFDILANESPELRFAWSRLKEWFERNPKLKFVDLRRLAREIPDVDDDDLALALQAMVRHQMVRQTFRVATPEGYLLDQDFASVSDIPARMPDRFRTHTFDTSEGDIIPGFRVETSSVER
jgi:hypothetical protein